VFPGRREPGCAKYGLPGSRPRRSLVRILGPRTGKLLTRNKKGGRMDIVFVVVIVALYGVTHWVTAAISRLGGIE